MVSRSSEVIYNTTRIDNINIKNEDLI